MSLKDQMQKDVGRVFFRMDHFAEQHKLNGRMIPMIVEYYTITGKSLSSIEGVFNYNCTIHFPKKEMKRLPRRQEKITIDEETNVFVVENVSHDMGVITLMLRGEGSV